MSDRHRKIEVKCESCGVFRIVRSRTNQPKLCPRCGHIKTHPIWQRQDTYSVGDIKIGSLIDKKQKRPYILVSCSVCGKEEWVITQRSMIPRLCRSCKAKELYKNGKTLQRVNSGNNHPGWKGGINQRSDGYVNVYVDSNHPYFPMAKITSKFGGYVLEHRLVMAENLGRFLRDDEIIHHYNGQKSDNRLENLYLMTSKAHRQVIPQLQKRILELEIKQEDFYGKVNNILVVEV